jgi:uridine kinase
MNKIINGMIIGIGGVSLAGKSMLAEKIKQYYKDKNVIVLCQDDFVFPEDRIPEIKGHIDWECPESIDFERFYGAVTENGKGYEMVIAEGLLGFYDKKINRLFDKKIFLEIPKQIFLERKAVDFRWGIEPPWYREYIWNSYLKYGQLPSEMIEVLIVKGDKPVNIGEVIEFIEKG